MIRLAGLALLAAWVALLVLFTPVEASAVPMRPVIIETTAYCLNVNLTASGTRVSHGTLAGGADFRIGQRLYVPDYGVGMILDRGDLKRNQIDVWVPSCWYANHIWGRRRGITAWVLG